MRAVVQRVANCAVTVEGQTSGHIRAGLLVYLGIETEDDERDVEYLADKIVHLRVFPDSFDKMNLSVKEVGKQVLVVSQFTLHADVRKGRRPSYDRAAPPERASKLYEAFLSGLERRGVSPQTGRFGAHMEVSYTNDGPVTILIDSKKLF